MSSPLPKRQRHLLHAFSTFQLGGPQARFVQLANSLGPTYRHTIVAMDNCFDASTRLAQHVLWESLELPVKKGSAVANRRCFRALLCERRPDLLVSYNWGAIEWAAANLPRVCPQVHVEDGFGPEEATRRLKRRSWARRVLLGWGQVQVVVASRTLEHVALREWGLPREQVVHIANGVEFPPVVPVEQARVRSGLCIGTLAGLRPEKNVARLLKAFAGIERPRDAWLLVVGDGPLRGELEELAVALAIKEQVVFAGYQSEPTAWLARMDLFAISSDTEQVPLAMLEAMALGKPVVATRVGDVPDILGPVSAQHLADPTDADFQRTLALALDRRDTWGELGECGRVVVNRHHAASTMHAQWNALFEGGTLLDISH